MKLQYLNPLGISMASKVKAIVFCALLMQPKKMIADLKSYWRQDVKAGFLVALLALPLSLGIASASGFPPMMGIWSAIVGGLLVTFFMGGELAIKGPAAGLVVIFASCVDAFGGGTFGWQMASVAVVLSGLVQMVLGKLGWASFLDFYPTSALRGLLAAIGVILLSRQIHLLVGISAQELQGLNVAELLLRIPQSLQHLEPSIALIGITTLLVAFLWGESAWGKVVPSALVAIAVGIFVAYFTQPELNAPHAQPMLNAGSFELNLNNELFHLDWSRLSQLGYFLFMLLAISTIELLLINKALQLLDPMQRGVNQNKDMLATGLGNVVSGLAGGLTMLSEIARSTASINYGAKTRWANFFHSLFLLLFVVVFAQVLSLIPVAALAALLIQVAFTLISPSRIWDTWKLGKEQFIVFLSTLVVCVVVDLFAGCVAGFLVKVAFSVVRGISWKDYVKVDFEMMHQPDQLEVRFLSSLVFTSSKSLEKLLSTIKPAQHVRFNLADCKVVDYASLQAIELFRANYERHGGSITLIGLEGHKSDSTHPLSSRWKRKRQK